MTRPGQATAFEALVDDYDAARPTYPAALFDALPPLDGRPAAVFCTCDVAPRGTLDVLTARLARKRARVLVAHAFTRKKSLTQVPAYVDLLLAEIGTVAADA